MRYAPILVLSLMLPATVMVVPPVFAIGHQGAKLALHAKARTTSQKTACNTWAPTNIPCTSYVTAAPVGSTQMYVYLVAAHGDPTLGIGGISCGVAYGSNLLVGWQRCSDLEFPSGNWPRSGGGNRITWATQTNCQRTVISGYESQGAHAIAGFFSVYAYGPDELAITQNFRVLQPELIVADCSAASWHLPATGATGSVRFTASGTVNGTNPCGGGGPPPPEPPQATVLLHIGSVVPPATACTAIPASPASVVTSAPARADGTADYFVYLLATPPYVLDPPGITALRFGIDVQLAGPGAGLHVWSWQTCGQGEIPTAGWPANGTGNTIVWTSSACPQDSLGSAGYFYLTAYSPAILAVTNHPETGQVTLADCAGQAGILDHVIPFERMGWVSFGGAASGPDANGCNPALESCEQPVPVRRTTWGAIKSKCGQ